MAQQDRKPRSFAKLVGLHYNVAGCYLIAKISLSLSHYHF